MTIRYVEATLSLDTSAYATGDVLAATQEVPLVCREGVATELTSLILLDKSDQNQDVDILFLRSNVSIGTENSAVSISDDDADEILGSVSLDMSADSTDLLTSLVATKTGIGIILSPSTSTTGSIFVAAICRGGTPTYAADGITLKLGLVDR